MSADTLAVIGTGMVTSVGLSAPAACAALRARLTNPVETRFQNSEGEWILSHEVPLETQWRGRAKLGRMAAMVVNECLATIDRASWGRIPLLLCVAEEERPGRIDGLDDELFSELTTLLGADFADDSLVIARGRVSVAVALLHARKLVAQHPAVLIVGTDSLLVWPTLQALDQQSRLLTAENSNGFIPGEAAAAVLVGRPPDGDSLHVVGLGFGSEPAPIDSGEPLRAEGLTQAIQAALSDAACSLHELDFRITDIAGEQYYFKEASLAFSRTLKKHTEEFDIWHPAECIGEAGSASGLATLVLADAACRKGYAKGRGILIHAANDAGERAAIVARQEVAGAR